MPTFVSAPHIRRPAARLAALRAHPDVALTIDTESFPPMVLSVRGRVSLTELDGVAEEYRLAARRCLAEEAAASYLAEIDQPSPPRPTSPRLISRHQDDAHRNAAGLGGNAGLPAAPAGCDGRHRW